MYVLILSGLLAAFLTALATEDYEWEVVSSKRFISHCFVSFSAAVTLGILLLVIGW